VNYKISYKDDYGNPIEGSLMLYLTNANEELLHTKNISINGYASYKIDLSGMSIGKYKISLIDFNNDVKVEKYFEISKFNFTFVYIGIAIVVVLGIILFIMKRR
jgi:hypothetical protein